jgi:hypothetical protein
MRALVVLAALMILKLARESSGVFWIGTKTFAANGAFILASPDAFSGP